MRNGNWRVDRSPSMTHEGRRGLYGKVRDALIDALGAKCSSCSFDDRRALVIDHKKSDGSKDRREHRGTSYYYHLLKRAKSGDLQVLCANCNMIKRAELREHAKPGCVCIPPCVKG